jgi:hypothetical protein
MSIDESLDVTRISSLADTLPPGTPLMNSSELHVPDKKRNLQKRLLSTP